jgi:hypothetical protein
VGLSYEPVDHIAIRFTGNDVAPVTTGCKELAAVISAAEDLLVAMMGDEHEDQHATPLCLVSVEDKSLGLKFAVHMALGMTLWLDLAAVINTKQFEVMNPKARQALSEIVSFVKRKNCTASLISPSGTIATFDYTIELPVEQKVKGRTSILGEVIRVGGEEPRIRIRLPSGKTLTCDTSETIAKELGHCLYEPVTCNGVATWDFDTNEVLKFKIEKARTFTKVPASKAFEDLAKAMPSVVNRLQKTGLEYADDDE